MLCGRPDGAIYRNNSAMNHRHPHFALKLLLPISALACIMDSAEAAVFYGPTSYRQRSDSPFNSEIQAGNGYLETFEDRLLSTPNVNIRGGGISRFQGVDEDDGVLDDRALCYVQYTTSGLTDLGAPWTFEITFTPNENGLFPRFVGFSLLGFIPESSPERYSRFFQFFDPAGQSLSDGIMSVPVVVVPDDTQELSSLGDQFVGAYADRGIARVLIGYTNRFDHLQYGYSVIPEPGGTMTLSGAAIAFALRRRRR